MKPFVIPRILAPTDLVDDEEVIRTLARARSRIGVAS